MVLDIEIPTKTNPPKILSGLFMATIIFLLKHILALLKVSETLYIVAVGATIYFVTLMSMSSEVKERMVAELEKFGVIKN